MERTKILIMGAAGRDFHNFNTFFRNNEQYEVIAFTATQIPDIDDRKYPAELAGSLYPEGIKIYPETELVELIKKFDIDEVIKMSIARCARVSYLNHDKSEPDPDKDMELYETLLESRHMSPFEHVAVPSFFSNFYNNFKGWKQHRYTIERGYDKN